MTEKEHRFSVIMTVYDNAQELEDSLPAFLTQAYKNDYEVIVVDESSTDSTEDVLKLQKQVHPHLYTTFLPKPNRQVIRRRLALTIGVKAAKYEWIIMADIHSAPTDDQWLTGIADAIDDETEMMLGYFRKKDIRLQTFSDISQSRCIITKAERMRANGHSGKRLMYIRGKYNFIVIRADKAHDVLKFFEQQLSFSRLLGLRLNTMFHNFR